MSATSRCAFSSSRAERGSVTKLKLWFHTLLGGNKKYLIISCIIQHFNCQPNLKQLLRIWAEICICFVFVGQNTLIMINYRCIQPNAGITAAVLCFKRAEEKCLLLPVCNLGFRLLVSNEDWRVWPWWRCVPVSAVGPPQLFGQIYGKWACRGAESRLLSTLLAWFIPTQQMDQCDGSCSNLSYL